MCISAVFARVRTLSRGTFHLGMAILSWQIRTSCEVSVQQPTVQNLGCIVHDFIMFMLQSPRYCSTCVLCDQPFCDWSVWSSELGHVQ